jgi:hypothetical protein
MARFTPGSLVVGLLRRTWILTAVTVVTCAAFAARAATTLVAPDPLAATPGDMRRHVAPPPAPRLTPRVPDGGQLVERNMFCSGCAPDAAPATGPVVAGAVLIATDIGAEARATIHVLASEAQGSWGIGDAIPGVGRVDRIGPMWVEVSDATGRHSRLSLLEAAGGSSGTAMPASAPAADPLADRIRKLDDQNYEVERQLVRDLVSAGARPGGPRFVPIVEGGEIKGVRLFGVVPGSVPHALGLKDRDQLIAVDGAPIKSVDQLLDLYVRLGQLSAVELSGTRAGKPLVRTLHLR